MWTFRILSDNTKLPRSNIAKILLESNRLQDFINNPQKFIEEVTTIIEYNKNTLSIDGIKYTKIEGQEYSLTEIFDLEDTKEVIAYLDSNAVPVEHSVYDYIIYDSATVGGRNMVIVLQKGIPEKEKQDLKSLVPC